MVRNRIKACDRCKLPFDIMYRIQITKSDPWQFVCHSCHSSIADDRPDYIYGGTWKSHKR